jgi:hypothetical protein
MVVSLRRIWQDPILEIVSKRARTDQSADERGVWRCNPWISRGVVFDLFGFRVAVARFGWRNLVQDGRRKRGQIHNGMQGVP